MCPPKTTANKANGMQSTIVTNNNTQQQAARNQQPNVANAQQKPVGNQQPAGNQQQTNKNATPQQNVIPPGMLDSLPPLPPGMEGMQSMIDDLRNGRIFNGNVTTNNKTFINGEEVTGPHAEEYSTKLNQAVQARDQAQIKKVVTALLVEKFQQLRMKRAIQKRKDELASMRRDRNRIVLNNNAADKKRFLIRLPANENIVDYELDIFVDAYETKLKRYSKIINGMINRLVKMLEDLGVLQNNNGYDEQYADTSLEHDNAHNHEGCNHAH